MKGNKTSDLDCRVASEFGRWVLRRQERDEFLIVSPPGTPPMVLTACSAAADLAASAFTTTFLWIPRSLPLPSSFLNRPL